MTTVGPSSLPTVRRPSLTRKLASKVPLTTAPGSMVKVPPSSPAVAVCTTVEVAKVPSAGARVLASDATTTPPINSRTS